MPRLSYSKAKENLKNLLDQVHELQDLSTDSQQFRKWRRNTRIAISYTFGEESPHVGEFTNISYLPLTPGIQFFTDDGVVPTHSDSDYRESYLNGLASAATLLESMIEEIECHLEEGDQSEASSSRSRDRRKNTNRVFVVHGRDEGTKHTVARFLENKNLKPVILSEQTDEGLTIIEKFEKHAQDVVFAVVLLTPDDVGALQGEENSLKPRARQNVILELGYFIGYLGRPRVCALLKGDIEKPSDYHGVIYIQMDEHEGWQKQLIKNLEAADFDAISD